MTFLVYTGSGHAIIAAKDHGAAIKKAQAMFKEGIHVSPINWAIDLIHIGLKPPAETVAILLETRDQAMGAQS
jgi:hypothetical protein